MTGIDYLLWLLAAAAGVAVFAWTWRSLPPGDARALVVPLIAGMATFVVFLAAAALWLMQPGDPWNAARLTPAVALHHGFKLYYPADAGPVLSTVVGPVAFLAYWPVAFASSSSTGLILAAVALNLLGVAAIGGWLVARTTESSAARVLAWLIGALLALHLPSLRYSLFNVHADAPALLLGAVGILLLLVRRDEPMSWARCAGSALCLSLGVWSKQSMLPIFLAAFVIVAWRTGARAGLRFLVVSAIVAALVSAGFCAACGVANLRDNMLAVPAHHPWRQMSLSTGEIYDRLHVVGLLARAKVLLAACLHIVRQNWPLFALLAAALASRAWRGAAPQTDRPHWLSFGIVALSLFPAAALGRVKVGGEVNHDSFVTFFLAAAVIAWLLESNSGERLDRDFRLMAFTGVLLLINAPQVLEYRGWTNAWHNQNQSAENYLRRHPNAVYFPWNPLAALLANRQLHHFDYGVYDRNLGRVTVTPQHLERHLPHARPVIATTIAHHDYILGTYFPDYVPRRADPELPGWRLYGPPAGAPAR